jgi:hypothetical protein
VNHGSVCRAVRVWKLIDKRAAIHPIGRCGYFRRAQSAVIHDGAISCRTASGAEGRGAAVLASRDTAITSLLVLNCNESS